VQIIANASSGRNCINPFVELGGALLIIFAGGAEWVTEAPLFV
jgi:hypothetical protein